MTRAGELRRRITFQAYVMIHDDFGGVIQGWEDRFSRWGHVRFLRGSEAVMQARIGLARKMWRAPTEEPGGVLWETGKGRRRNFRVKRCGWR
nr:hypothetical protein 5 [Moraxellaceae bacterium]